MELPETVSVRDRLVSTILAVALATIAIRSLRNGKRLSGALAAAGAFAVGHNAITEPGRQEETAGTDAASEDGELHCSICGEPIVPGQRRSPDENNEIAHEACQE